MTKHTTEYSAWLSELKHRYLQAQLKAASAVNSILVEYYWNLGKDIENLQFKNFYGAKFFDKLSKDLQDELPDIKGLSPVNIRYANRFYMLYAKELQILQQPVEEYVIKNLLSIPWSHHCRIIDKCEDNPKKALFFVNKTIENNWSRAVLLNFLDTNLYEREGKAITNFKRTLPELQSDLAQQITKDPYCFDFLALTTKYQEKELEDALVGNIIKFLLELGEGFSFMGRQVRIVVNNSEFFPDLLFYNTKIHAYVVIELKTEEFKPEHLGQLSFYVSAINHQKKTEIDNPTIGLLICKTKNNVVAQYSLENYSQPIGISEYQLSQLYPVDFKSSLPTIEEIERELSKND